MKPAITQAAHHVSLCINVSESAYRAIRQLARDTGCKLDDVLVEALSALLQRCGKGSVGEIEMRSGMIEEIGAACRAEDHWDRAGNLLTKRLTIDLSPELHDRIKLDSARRRLSVPDAIRRLLESVYPEARHG
jgi:hypothetical protein